MGVPKSRVGVYAAEHAYDESYPYRWPHRPAVPTPRLCLCPRADSSDWAPVL